MALIAPYFISRFMDGPDPAAGYRLWTYESGTTTPKTTYTSSAATTPNTNPIVLDENGECALWLGSGSYSLKLETPVSGGSALVKQWDDVSVSAESRVAQVETQTATAAQTVVDLTQTTYTPGTNSLMVFVDGILVRDYSETSSTRVTFSSGLQEDSEIVMVAGTPVNGTGAGDSALTAYVPGGTDAVPTIVQTALRRIPAVGDFATVQEAVAYCVLVNKPLLWDADYTVTGNIPSFHSVRHWGKGSATRGTDVWAMSPIESTTFTLYVDPAGDDTNDGLTALFPLETVQKAYDIIKDRAPLTGRYTIQMAAGTYTENVNVSSLTQSDYPIDLRGPDVSGHPNVPTAVITASDTAGDVLTFASQGRFRVYDVRLTGATTGKGCTLNNTQVTFTNVHIDACLSGVSELHGSVFTAVGGIWTGRGKAVSGGDGFQSFYNATHALQSSDAAGALIIQDYEHGLLVNEGAQGHLDYTKVHDCGTGMLIQRGAGACNTDQMEFLRNDLAIDARGPWLNNNIVFGTGADANTINVRTSGGAPEFDFRTSDSVSKTSRQQVQTALSAHTGTTTETQVWAWSDIRPWMISAADDNIDVDLCLTVASASLGTIRVRLSLWDGTTDDTLADVTLPIGTTDAVVRGIVNFATATTQRCFMTAIHNAGALCGTYGTGALTLKNLSGELRLKYTLSNSADSVSTRILRLSTTLGG